MAQALQRNNLGNFIPEGVKKQKEEDHAPKKGNHHALVAINSSSNSWIIDFGDSGTMKEREKRDPSSSYFWESASTTTLSLPFL